jgi:hypothetical protein
MGDTSTDDMGDTRPIHMGYKSGDDILVEVGPNTRRSITVLARARRWQREGGPGGDWQVVGNLVGLCEESRFI